MNHCYRFFFLCFFLLLSAAGWAQTSSSNYVISRTYKQAGIIETFNTPTFSASANQASSQISYFDGLGKPTQQVMAFEAASKGDVVILTEYDNLQRPVRTFLPAPFKNNGGEMRSADAIKSAAGYYKNASKVSAPVGNDEALAAQTVYDNTPLSRVSTQKAPGASNVVSQIYGVNSDGDVKLYQVSGTGPTTSLQPQGNYPAGSLTWTQTTDENGGQITEFQDRYGRTVLRRVKATDDTKLDTYYIYDEKGQLRVVLQPKYASFGENDLNKNAFLYSYDDRGRLISKKVPGANAVQMTYKGDTELVETSTDGKNTVFYYKYDNLNRQVEMGVKPGGSETPLLYTYYDNYSFNPFQYFTNDLNITASPFANNPQQARTGLTTGTKARVLKPDGTFGDWLQTAIYYDDKYRVVQTVRQLYGFSWQAFERVSYKLSFDGKPEEEWITQATGSITYKLTKKYSYDHANRLIKTDHVLYENDVQKKAYTHTEQLYNELGKLAAKSLHKGRQILTYKYTPRGWLGNHQTSNGQPFSLNLSYQDNGNITQQSWATKSYSGGMDLSYDKASRLTGATGTGNFGGYHENPIQYDPNGNITNLTRQYSGLVIDQLGYQYHGNQLHRVDDNSDNQSQAVKGFINNANADDELSYDANGNMVKDDNRGVTNIAYNVLNLPRTVTRNGRTVQYTYDATGIKHKTEAPDNVNTFYAGSFEYRAENSLLRIGLEEGQLIKSDTFIVNYYLRDHLGNVRSVIDENGTIIQETEYYAFGLPIQRNGSDRNKYLYNGKEKQPETEWLDYGARMYDPSIGSWNSIDPLSEVSRRWSPYNYVYSNPLLFIDPDGMLAEGHYEGAEAQQAFRQLQLEEQDKGPGKEKQREDRGTSKSKSATKNPDFQSQVGDIQESAKETLKFFVELFDISNGTNFSGINYDPEQNYIGGGVPSIGVRSVPRINVTKTAANGARLSINGARLKEHLRQIEEYGSGGFKELNSGRIRYYAQDKLNRGNDNYFRMVREWDPATGGKRTWFETLNPEKQVIQVRPELGNGVKTHYVFDGIGNFLYKW